MKYKYQTVTVALSTKMPVEGARVMVETDQPVFQRHQLQQEYSFRPQEEVSVSPFVIKVGESPVQIRVKILQKGVVVYDKQETLQLMVTHKQSLEEQLVDLLVAKKFTLDQLPQFDEIDDVKLASIVQKYIPDQVPLILNFQMQRGFSNTYLLATQLNKSQQANAILRYMYQSSNAGLNSLDLNSRVCAVVEIHPYIRSRMLNPSDVPSQLREIIRRQVIHSLLLKDFENLFLQLVLADDYEFAKIVKDKCSFTRRHQQLLAYYMAATKQSAEYSQLGHFNTFSSESAAKYGKITETKSPLSGAVEGLELRLWDESKSAEYCGVQAFNGICIQRALQSMEQQELTIAHQSIGKTSLLLRTERKGLLVNVPEHRRIRVSKLLGRQIRIVDV